MVKLEQETRLLDKHRNGDFFIADIFDGLPFKDDMATMAYPVFSLTSGNDMRKLEYSIGNINLSIKPGFDGLPTIFDKDVLLYCGSQLVNEINQGRIPLKTLRISVYDLLVTTNRATNGKGYFLLKKALDRLKGVTIKTNIKTNKREVTKAFGLIDGYEIIESSRVKERMVRLEITLSDWFYNSILGKEVLTISRDYFRLRGALERRIYEIARKHCGQNAKWSIRLESLKEKTGSYSTMPKFRFMLKKMVKNDLLPDYSIFLSEDDLVIFKRRLNTSSIDAEETLEIKPETIQKALNITLQSGTNLDFAEIHNQFIQQIMNGFKPKNLDASFIAFVKKKVSNCL